MADKGTLRSDLNNFTILHNEFIESELLTINEKMVFIAIKRHLNWEKNNSFPSLKTICKYSRLSKPTVIKTLKSLEDKKIIRIEHRRDDEQNCNKSNLYVLYDFKELWVSKEEEVESVIEGYEENRIISILESKGYVVTKEKELESEPAKAQNQASEILNQFDVVNTTLNSTKSQVQERYTLDQIKEIYEYNIMIADHPEQKQSIDSIMNILHTTLNSTRESIRVGKEDKPAMTVISKLMKLTFSEILYAINKFNSVTEKISNPTGYMLTILYNAKEQMSLEIANQVEHDMTNGLM